MLPTVQFLKFVEWPGDAPADTHGRGSSDRWDIPSVGELAKINRAQRCKGTIGGSAISVGADLHRFIYCL